LFEDFHNATRWERSTQGVVLAINNPAVRQRYLGGTIRPVNSRMLTLPAQGAAYGVRARDAGITLKVMFAPDPKLNKWRLALVAPEAVTKETGAPRKDGTRRRRVIKPSGIWYWLVSKVTQQGDKSTLPTSEQLLAGIRSGIEKWARGILGRG
jgi:hypothetical protein